MKKEIKNNYPETFLEADERQAKEGNPYMGNIWGWRFSMFGLVVLVLAGGFTAWLHFTGRVDMRTGEPFPQEKTMPVETDSLKGIE